MEQLSLQEKIFSKRNRLFFRLRSVLQFERSGYTEKGVLEKELEVYLRAFNKEELAIRSEIEGQYLFSEWQRKLSLPVYEKNLSTLWTLEQFKAHLPSTPPRVIEAGCQDFARLPALRTFFPWVKTMKGIEIDAYPILRELHSRADKAKYYISLSSERASYEAKDFFQFVGNCELLLCFYPFVSPNPALAWGLPAELGDAALWLRAIDRSLAPGGQALIVHQGEWEEATFDEARSEYANRLEIVERKRLPCPFYPLPHPPYVTLYRKRDDYS